MSNPSPSLKAMDKSSSFAPSQAPTLDEWSYEDWMKQQNKRGFFRVIIMFCFVGIILIRVLIGFWLERRRTEAERRAQTLEEERKKNQRAELIQNELKVITWSEVSNNGGSKTDAPISRTGEEMEQDECCQAEQDSSFSSNEGPSCAICFKSFEEAQLVCQSVNESCPHIFCKDCITSWLLKNDFCPICRRPYLSLNASAELTDEGASDEV